jgi:hypothetical protein
MDSNRIQQNELSTCYFFKGKYDLLGLFISFERLLEKGVFQLFEFVKES